MRKLAGLTLEALSDAIGVSYQQLQKYEDGVNRLSAVRLSKIRKTLGVPMEEFIPEKYR